MDPDQITIGKGKISRRFVVWCLFFLTLLFGFIAFIVSANIINLVVHGKGAQGVVTAVTEQRSGRRGVMWNAEVSYTAQDGKEYGGMIVASPTFIGVGDKISILYNPNDPSHIVISNYFFLLVQVVLFYLLPLATLAVGIAALRKPKTSAQA